MQDVPEREQFVADQIAGSPPDGPEKISQQAMDHLMVNFIISLTPDATAYFFRQPVIHGD